MAARSPALKIDWARVTTALGLRGSTVQGLQAFKKRNEDARRKIQMLSELPTTVDFAHYRKILGNQSIVDDIEQRFTSFKPATYDLSRQLKAIDAFESEAVKNAEQARENLDVQMKDLKKTLDNIDKARSWDELTVDDLNETEPELLRKTEEMVSKGYYRVPGYNDRFPNLALM